MIAPVARETILPLAAGLASARVIAFDQTDGAQTQLSMVNAGASAVELAVRLRDEGGIQLAPDVIPLAPGKGISVALADWFDASRNARGTLEVSTAAPSAVAISAWRVASSGQVNSIPVLVR
jgi:hypothetical protein